MRAEGVCPLKCFSYCRLRTDALKKYREHDQSVSDVMSDVMINLRMSQYTIVCAPPLHAPPLLAPPLLVGCGCFEEG